MSWRETISPHWENIKCISQPCWIQFSNHYLLTQFSSILCKHTTKIKWYKCKDIPVSSKSVTWSPTGTSCSVFHFPSRYLFAFYLIWTNSYLCWIFSSWPSRSTLPLFCPALYSRGLVFGEWINGPLCPLAFSWFQAMEEYTDDQSIREGDGGT